MPRPRRPVTAPRKLPSQARSTQLVADILKAAVRVLEREGALRFTTTRVAEAAGVSVGSIYQYFPNKHAILFRLQVDEWERTSAALAAILGDDRLPPARRLRAMMRAFFVSEREEAPLRAALDVALPSYDEAPESRAVRARGRRILRAFVAAAAPHATPRQRSFGAELVVAAMSAIGKQLSERRPSDAEIRRWADAIADMLTGYLAGLAPRPRRARQRG
ncbi:TetR/AcrR family transcriptional regulator [Sorangium sp. So ce1000]|uniref:TetR/AcrR family transcriptional regulator n=1 Tax=Sorangium sp. So ce1000 TaxID=3133325 RepID=UPI003F5F91F6